MTPVLRILFNKIHKLSNTKDASKPRTQIYHISLFIKVSGISIKKIYVPSNVLIDGILTNIFEN